MRCVLVYVEGTRVTRRPIAWVIPLLARSSNAEKVLHALNICYVVSACSKILRRQRSPYTDFYASRYQALASTAGCNRGFNQDLKIYLFTYIFLYQCCCWHRFLLSRYTSGGWLVGCCLFFWLVGWSVGRSVGRSVIGQWVGRWEDRSVSYVNRSF